MHHIFVYFIKIQTYDYEYCNLHKFHSELNAISS